MQTLLLSQRQVGKLLSMDIALPAVERAFATHGRGEAIMPPKVYIELEHHHGDFRAMPAYMDGAAGVKWVNSHPQNPQTNRLPAVMAVYILSDPSTAAPLAIMDGTLLTAFRTGAAAGVASKHLCTGKPETLGIIGCGVQSHHLIDAHRAIFPAIQVRASDLNRAAAERLAQNYDGEAVSIEDAAGCDILCTATPSRSPVVRREWIRPGCHINAMGADAEGKQELDPRILSDARVFLDDVDQAAHSGEVNVPISKGDYALDSIYGTLGEVVAKRIKGRKTDEEITVFDSTGLALQDVALAKAIYETAREQGIGSEIELIS